jgi:hypothetical protein
VAGETAASAAICLPVQCWGLAAQSLDLLDDLLWRWLAQPMRPRAAVFKSCQTFDAVPGKPFADSPRADAYG